MNTQTESAKSGSSPASGSLNRIYEVQITGFELNELLKRSLKFMDWHETRAEMCDHKGLKTAALRMRLRASKYQRRAHEIRQLLSKENR